MFKSFLSTLLVLYALFPLNVSAGVPSHAKFSGAYDLISVGKSDLVPRVCGHDLFLSITDTQLTNLTIDGTEYGGKHHHDVRNLSRSLIDICETSNLSFGGSGSMILLKEGTFAACGEKKLGIILEEEPDGMRYLSFIAYGDHVNLTEHCGDRTGCSFDSWKLNNTICVYKALSAKRIWADTINRIKIGAAYPIISVPLLILIQAGLTLWGRSNVAYYREKFPFLFTMQPVFTFAMFVFQELGLSIFDSRLKPRLSSIFLEGFMVYIIPRYLRITIVFYLKRAYHCYKSRLESNPADLAVGWILGIGATLASLPFFGPFGAFAIGLGVAETATRSAIRSQRRLAELEENDA